MPVPSFFDYVAALERLFLLYQETADSQMKKGRPFCYSQIGMILFFVIMTFRRIHKFGTQCRWLESHPAMLSVFGWIV